MAINALSDGAVRDLSKIKRMVLGTGQPLRSPSNRRPMPDIEYEGQLTTALSAPTNGWTGATTAMFQPYTFDPTDTSTPQKMISDVNIPAFQIVNRDTTLALSSGMYVRVRMVNGEWKISWTACPT